MKIKNARVFTENGIFENRDVCVEGEYITENSIQGKEWDATGYYILPGLVDIHLHGCNGFDMSDGTMEAFDEIMEYEARSGITAVCPAIASVSEGQMSRVYHAIGNYNNDRGAYLTGVCMEGPFLSRDCMGAQCKSYACKPNAAMFAKMQENCRGLIRQVVVAPEEDVHMEMIDAIHDQVIVSVGHTTCDYDMAAKAFSRGCSHVTHLYNAMNEYTHRDPGVVGAAADHEQVYVELICDGIHNHPSVIRNTFRMFGKERVCMISDSIAISGLDSGVYKKGMQKLIVRRKRAVLDDGTLAGGMLNLMEMMLLCVQEFGVPLETAVAAASLNPARSLGIDRKFGSVTAGKYANLVIMDENLKVIDVIVRGKRSI